MLPISDDAQRDIPLPLPKVDAGKCNFALEFGEMSCFWCLTELFGARALKEGCGSLKHSKATVPKSLARLDEMLRQMLINKRITK